MREIIRDFKGIITNVNASKLKPEFSPDCSDVKFSPIHQLRTRLGFDKINTVSFDEPITLIDQIENDGTYVNTFIQGTSMYEGTSWIGWTAITNVTELQAMKFAGKYYLANDIDASATSGWNGGEGFVPIPNFTGILDGDGHTITGLFINRPSTGQVGLFGASSSSEIKNVGLINVDIIGQQAGGLVGQTASNDTITNCYSTGSVSGVRRVGGLVGYNNNSNTITNCYSHCSVSGSQGYLGGLVGDNALYNVITNCHSTGAVSGSGAHIGGLIGHQVNSTANDCFWDTETSGQATSAGGTGKLTAQMKQEATFENWDFSTIWDITEGVTYPWLK